jgi:hypothetical protein
LAASEQLKGITFGRLDVIEKAILYLAKRSEMKFDRSETPADNFRIVFKGVLRRIREIVY